ncbi:MAG: nitrate reductase [Roseiarcus sp.]|jgi:assimilatory nitrate reductase catalytic subunit
MNARAPAPSVATACPYCGVGCGIIATPDGQGGAAIAGDRDHPANAGRLCVKGAALGETLGTEARLLHPTIHGVRTTWPRALDAVAAGFSVALDAHGPQSIAMYLSGQLLTEDYYVANKLMKGFLGSANVDTNSRLCMASSVAGHRRAFGADVVPGCYDDFDEADVIVFVGSNAAWCHPVLFQRAEQAKARRGARIVAIDPRRTATAELADLHLPIAPGADTILFCRLLVEIADSDAIDRAYVEAHTSGFDQALEQARAIAPDRATTAARCGVAERDLAALLALWIGAPRVVTAFSQGVNQSARGTDKVNAILNVHLATGRIGKPGCGPFSLTGQPNAMGGREVGGLANQLAAHMDFRPADVDRVRRFWSAPAMATAPGLKAVELFEAVERGAIKALWIMSTNPAVSLPRADAMRAALGKLDFLVVSEVSAHVDGLLDAAMVVLPAAAWGEKDGTVTNSERVISRQRPFRAPPGEAWPDWRQVSEVARRLGHGSAFAYRGPADIFREHAALSGFENDGARAFDIGAVATLSEAEYDALTPAQWPRRRAGAGRKRFFSQGGFFHPDGRARFVAVEDPPSPRLTEAFGLVLNTGRVRDQWHTMTRTGLSPRLARHREAPFVEVHPDDAARLGLSDGGFARMTTAHGAAELRVVATASQRRGSLFAPTHWTAATAGRARVGALTHASVDPVSGQPDSKATPATIAPSPIAAEGFLVARRRVALPDWLAHARIAVAGGEAVAFASAERPAALQAFLSNWLGRAASPSRRVDEGGQRFQSATFADGRLETLLHVAPKLDRAALDAAIALLARPTIDAQERRFALAGRTLAAGDSASPLVCACFAVRRDAIEAAIAAGAESVDAVGRATRAGTNCGSCRAEIRQLVTSRDAVAAIIAG